MKFPNGILKKNFSLKNITSFKVGGKCDFYFIPDTLKDLQEILTEAHKNNIDYYILGNGSNVLFSDNGFKGIIINLKGFLNYIRIENSSLICGAGVFLNTVVDFAKDNNLSGLENLAGIPGTLGGAVIMNAGAFNSEIGEVVKEVKVLTSNGKIKIIPKEKIKFDYRSAKPLEKYIILNVALQLSKGDKKNIGKKIKDILNKREKKQPLKYPSAGSVFKRPENNYAGKLIEDSGLKGYKIGGAMISSKHSNFIINTGKARAQDIYDLIVFTQKKVYEKFKIKLKPEIKLIGF